MMIENRVFNTLTNRYLKWSGKTLANYLADGYCIDEEDGEYYLVHPYETEHVDHMIHVASEEPCQAQEKALNIQEAHICQFYDRLSGEREPKEPETTYNEWDSDDEYDEWN